MSWKFYYKKLQDLFFKQVSAASLGFFRIGFGIICYLETFRFAREIDGNSPNDFITFELLFKYRFFEWVELLPYSYLVVIVAVLKVAAVLIAIGFIYRLSVIIYFLGYTYFFLVEMSHFNNHYYLLILMLGFMMVVDANKFLAIDNLFKRNKNNLIANWQLVLFKFQVVWVYFCAGLVKLNYDWLSGWTMKTAIFKGADFADDPFFHSMFFVYFYSWTGLIFDLCIGFFLLFRKTRVFALIVIVVFHFLNAKTLTIGIFPFLMIWITTLFFEPDWPERLWNKIFKRKEDQNVLRKASATSYRKREWVTGLLVVYFVVQLVLPARHHFIEGNVDWTGEGVMFAWRMKSAGRSGMEGRYNFYLTDKETNQEITASIRLSNRQRKFIMYKPVLMLQVRDHLLVKVGREKEAVRMEIDILSSINGSEYKPLFVRNANLCDFELNYFRHNKFITKNPPVNKIGQQ